MQAKGKARRIRLTKRPFDLLNYTTPSQAENLRTILNGWGTEPVIRSVCLINFPFTTILSVLTAHRLFFDYFYSLVKIRFSILYHDDIEPNTQVIMDMFIINWFAWLFIIRWWRIAKREDRSIHSTAPNLKELTQTWMIFKPNEGGATWNSQLLQCSDLALQLWNYRRIRLWTY